MTISEGGVKPVSAIKHIENRVVYINFDEYSDYRITEDRYGYTAYQISTILGPRRRFGTAQELQAHIEEYFRSCQGPVLMRSGAPVLDADGQMIIRTVIPLTMSGLARHLGVTTRALMDYKYQVVQKGIPDEFLPVLNQARQRIEEYAETRLYDTDGSKGAQFALSATFGWETPKERSERKNMKARTRLMQDDQKLKQKQFDKDEDGGLNITIVRAGRRQELPVEGAVVAIPDVTGDAVT
jgi:hypothetical protein